MSEDGRPTVEERLGLALNDRAAATTVSPDGWDRIEERVTFRRQRRAVTVWVAAPAFALAAVLVTAVVVIPDRQDRSVTAGPAAPAQPAAPGPDRTLVGRPGARQVGTVIASGEMNGVLWQAAAYESEADPPEGTCVEIAAEGDSVSTCGAEVPDKGGVGPPDLLKRNNRIRFAIVPAGPGVARVRLELSDGGSAEGSVVRPAGLSMGFLVTTLPIAGFPTAVVGLDEAGRELSRRAVPTRPASPSKSLPPVGAPTSVAPPGTAPDSPPPHR
jgi:hypothetical protein